jgi:glucosamine-6-phosphate deaminase
MPDDLLRTKYRSIHHPEVGAIYVYATKSQAASAAAKFIEKNVVANPHLRLTVATGQTQTPVWTEIQKDVALGKVSFQDVRLFHLDGRWKCSLNNTAGFRRYILDTIVTPLHMPARHINLINEEAKNPIDEARRYNALLKIKPIDLCILGIGPADTDGKGAHMAFCERGTPFRRQTYYLPVLAGRTIIRDRIERKESVPDGAITQGPANIIAAKKIMLIAYGKDKGISLLHGLYDDIHPENPISILRKPKVGKKVTLFIDEEAAEVIETYRRKEL